MRIALFILLTAALPIRAALPPAPQLLPADTLAVFSVPDCDRAVAYWGDSAQGKLWRDPAIQPLREKMVQRWKENLAGPLEQKFGIKLADYANLLHGQLTFAVTGLETGGRPGILILMDAKDQADNLKTRLADLKRKWADAGKPLKSEKIRDVELTTLILSKGVGGSLGKALPGSQEDADDEEPETKGSKTLAISELTFGQLGSLMIAGNRIPDIEKVLARLSSGGAPSLAEQAAFEANQSLFRDALAFGWLDFARTYEKFSPQMGRSSRLSTAGSLAPRPDKLLAATGLNGLKTIAARVGGSPEGTAAEVFLGIPESARKGIFRLLAPLAKEAAPPPFVGADVVKFSRFRVDGQKAWGNLESMLTAISPQLAGLLQMGFQAAGKDTDPNFDLKTSLVGNLGDDFISVRRNPRSLDPEALNAPPSLYLIGSAHPEQLVQGMKAATSLLPMAAGEPNVLEREFLGRKIFTLTMPALPAAEGTDSAKPRTFSFAATAGCAALSTDSAMLEEYLRGLENPARPLREKAGLGEAAQRVGGMSTGLFGYQNQVETARAWIASARQESAKLEKLLSLAGAKGAAPDELEKMKQWLDTASLPPFEKIAKYFHFVVYSGSASEEGLSLKVFAPVPPRMNEP